MNLRRTSRVFIVVIILELIIALPGLSSGFGEIWLAGTLAPTLIVWAVINYANKGYADKIAQDPSATAKQGSYWNRNRRIIILLILIFFVIPGIFDLILFLIRVSSGS